MNPTDIHCLYPITTQSLKKQLAECRALNFHGRPELGRQRILEDLKKLLQTDGAWVVLIDMKTYVKNYSNFIKDFNTQAALTGEHLPRDLSEWKTGIRKRKEKTYVLLDNFDALMGTKEIDPQFAKTAFVNQINALKNDSTGVVGLLCATTKTHSHNQFYQDGKMTNASPFILMTVAMPALLPNETIEKECNHQLADCGYWQALPASEKHPVYRAIGKHEATPYGFMQYVIGQIRDLDAVHEYKPVYYLRKWRECFDADNSSSWPKWRSRFWERNKGYFFCVMFLFLLASLVALWYFWKQGNQLGIIWSSIVLALSGINNLWGLWQKWNK